MTPLEGLIVALQEAHINFVIQEKRQTFWEWVNDEWVTNVFEEKCVTSSALKHTFYSSGRYNLKAEPLNGTSPFVFGYGLPKTPIKLGRNVIKTFSTQQ